MNSVFLIFLLVSLSLGTRFLHTSEGKMLVTRLVPCPRCLTTHNERENTKSWQDWSFLKKLPQQPRVPELLRVSQDSGMGQESPRESQNAPDEASDALGMISHEKSLITTFGHKH